jgi:hypothetical protein
MRMAQEGGDALGNGHGSGSGRRIAFIHTESVVEKPISTAVRSFI